jgi:hypothetical protein
MFEQPGLVSRDRPPRGYAVRWRQQPIRAIIGFFDPQQVFLRQVDERNRDVPHNHPAQNYQADFSGLQALE